MRRPLIDNKLATVAAVACDISLARDRERADNGGGLRWVRSGTPKKNSHAESNGIGVCPIRKPYTTGLPKGILADWLGSEEKSSKQNYICIIIVHETMTSCASPLIRHQQITEVKQN